MTSRQCPEHHSSPPNTPLHHDTPHSNRLQNLHLGGPGGLVCEGASGKKWRGALCDPVFRCMSIACETAHTKASATFFTGINGFSMFQCVHINVTVLVVCVSRKHTPWVCWWNSTRIQMLKHLHWSGCSVSLKMSQHRQYNLCMVTDHRAKLATVEFVEIMNTSQGQQCVWNEEISKMKFCHSDMLVAWIQTAISVAHQRSTQVWLR